MFSNLSLESILFLDIETVPGTPNFDYLDEDLKHLWEKKAAVLARNDESPEEMYGRAGIYAEFGKIVCISVGKLTRREGGWHYRVTSYYDHDEKKLLQDFSSMLERASQPYRLCGHNAQEFDFPFIARRMLINGLKLPYILNIAGAKPWEVRDKLMDTMQLWKFGDYKYYTSLNLLCKIFNIPTPKDDIDGSQVANVYYNENDLDRIARYCEKDTLAVAQLLLRFQGEKLVELDNVEVV